MASAVDSFGGSRECQITEQYHLALVLHAERTHRGRVALLGDGKHTEALVVQVIDCIQNPLTNLCCERLYCSVTLGIATDGEHLLHRTLGDHLGLALLVLNHRGQTAADEVERDFIHLHIVFG